MTIQKKLLTFSFIISVFFTAAQNGEALFKGGDNGYTCFRIPAIVKTPKGTILAFAEGRKKDCGDAGDIDIVLRRSTDNGKTWGAMTVVWNDSGNTCGNPAPVVNEKNGRVLLLSTWNLGEDHEKQIIDQTSKDSRRIFVLSSDDEGASWSAAREITKDVKLPGWTWYATGPCNGIQIKAGPHKGRLVVACDHIEADSKKYFSHAICSDDGGNNWKMGGSTPTDKVNECTVAELSKGVLMLNMRNYTSVRARQVSTSNDGGESWSPLWSDTTLIEPVCQGSLISYKPKGSRKNALAFSNPADTKKRVNMTVKLSFDDGKTWKKARCFLKGLPHIAICCSCPMQTWLVCMKQVKNLLTPALSFRN